MKIKAGMLFKAGKITSSPNSESRTSHKTEASSMAEWETVAFSWLAGLISHHVPLGSGFLFLKGGSQIKFTSKFPSNALMF